MTKYAILFGVAKGLIVSAILFALDIAFWKQLLIAGVSATISSVGVVIAALITIDHVKHRDKRDNRTRSRKDDDSARKSPK